MRPYQASLGTRIIAVLCAALLIPANVASAPLPHPQAATTPASSAARIPNDQLDSLVAPIALYPDPLLAQVLAASTYPLEIIQLQQWMTRHPDLKGEALAAAVEKEDWDPAVQGLAALPDVVKRLGDDIKWTTDLGNAFLAQQSDVMDAVQRMRTEGLRCGKPEDHRAAEGHDSGCPDQGSHRDPASQSTGDLRPGLQPRRRLRPSALSLSAYLLPARGLLRCRCRDRVRRRRRDGRVLGRRLGLRPALGLRQRQHQREQPVCEPLQPLQQLQPVRRQLESQSGASRRCAVRGSQHREPLWRHGAGRFDGDAAGDGPAELGCVGADTACGRRQSEREWRSESCRRVACDGAGREPEHGEPGANRGTASAGGGDRVGNRSIPSSQGSSSRSGNAFGGASSSRPSSSAARSSSQRGSASVGASRARSGGGGGRRR